MALSTTILPLGRPSRLLIGRLVDGFQRVGIYARAAEAVELPEAAYDPDSGCYSAEGLLAYVAESAAAAAPGHGTRVVGVTGKPVRAASGATFGECERPGEAAVVSYHDLAPEGDEALLEQRLLKDALHLLGHTLGLKHCSPDCVMRLRAGLEEVDAKPANFCDACRLRIGLAPEAVQE